MCLSLGIGTANNSPPPHPHHVGMQPQPPHGGGSRLCKLLLTHKSSLPRIKDEDSVIPSETLGVLRLKFLRGSWAVGGFRSLPLCGQGLCCYLRGNRNCDQRCDCWVFFLHCSENSRRGKMPPRNALRITDLMISPAPGTVAGTQELLHRHLLNK